MNDAWLRAWRPICSSLRSSQCQTNLCLARRRLFPSRLTVTRQEHRSRRNFEVLDANCFKRSQQLRGFATRAVRSAQQINPSESPYTNNAGEARFRATDLSPAEIQRILGRPSPSVRVANRVLRMLQYRRLNGTLDLDLPTQLGSIVRQYPHLLGNGLRWLRETYPVDEDAAIIARIVKEDENAEKAARDRSDSQLISRAQELGLYKPQSGTYDAKLGPNNDVYGESVLDKIKAQREREKVAKAENLKKIEKEKLDRAIAEGKMGPMELTTDVNFRDIRRARYGGTVQRFSERANQWSREYAKRATSALRLESPEVKMPTFVKRVLPTLLFASGLTVVCYYYAQSYGNPPQSKRLFPAFSVSEATIGSIIALNVAVFLLWKGFPPAIKMLNKYFLQVIATPTWFSALGCVFSQTELSHLMANMLGIYLLGQSLHEQVTRPTFLAVFLTAGTLSSFACLVFYTARRMFNVTSLGASGAVAGIFACSATLNPNARFTLFFLPQDLQEQYSLSGMTSLKLIIGSELFTATTMYLGITAARINVTAHLAGFAVGAAWGWALRNGWVWKRRRRDTGEEVWIKCPPK